MHRLEEELIESDIYLATMRSSPRVDFKMPIHCFAYMGLDLKYVIVFLGTKFSYEHI